MAVHEAPLSLGFSRQEHWSGLPFPSPMRESEVAQSCPTLRDPMDCSLPGSSIHGIFQARVLEWGAIAFSTESKFVIFKSSTRDSDLHLCLRITKGGFPGGSVVENLLTNAGDMGLILGLGRSHMPQSSQVPAPHGWAGALDSRAATSEPTL